jgi:hypothetical protein
MGTSDQGAGPERPTERGKRYELDSGTYPGTDAIPVTPGQVYQPVQDLTDEDRARGIKMRSVGYHTHDGMTWEHDTRCFVCKTAGFAAGAQEQGWIKRADVVRWLRERHTEDRPFKWTAGELADVLEAGEAP